ncbi:MAG TPA: DUF2878 family protein [Anaeromyxobacter sp.]
MRALAGRMALADAGGQQAAWWATVLSAAAGVPPAVAALPGALVVVAHLALRREMRARLAALALAAAAYGWATDSALVRLGLLSFAGGGATAPAWMPALWAAFAVGLTASMRAVAGWRPALVALAGALAGPIAYRGGQALGGLELGPEAGAALAGVALQWALGAPALAALASHALSARGRVGRRAAAAAAGEAR